jgi:thiamine biosynthesis lipoprotein
MITSFNLIGAVLLALTVESVWVERQAYLMGTLLTVKVEAADRDTGMRAIEVAFGEVRRVEMLLSTWRDDSELARLNRAPLGIPELGSTELREMLAEVMAWTERSGGAFDPAVGALVDAWDLRGEGREPTAEERELALRASGSGAFAFDEEGGHVTRAAAGAWLDSGGFGKGAALRAAESALRSLGILAARLDFGGQLLVYGHPAADAGGWEVGVADPRARDHVVAMLWLEEGSVATSGQSERFVEVGGEKHGHILDPRTGKPVDPWGSVTVATRDPLVADIVATAAFVMGPEEGMRWVQNLADVGVFFVTTGEGTLRESWNEAFERYRTKPDH